MAPDTSEPRVAAGKARLGKGRQLGMARRQLGQGQLPLITSCCGRLG